MKSILITGISRGIGLATAKLFLDKGWSVFGTSTTGKTPLIHSNLRTYQLDIADSISLDEFKKDFGANKIDVLLNNAGFAADEATVPPINVEVLRKDMEVNLFGTLRLTEIVIDNINAGGKIICISSMMSSLNCDFTYGDPAYRISKAALNMYTLNLAKDPRLLAKNIIVAAFDPGWVKTDMGGQDASRKPEEPAQELFDLATQGFETGKFYRGTTIREW